MVGLRTRKLPLYLKQAETTVNGPRTLQVLLVTPSVLVCVLGVYVHMCYMYVCICVYICVLRVCVYVCLCVLGVCMFVCAC